MLTKPGKLTDEEWVIMRRHPVDGAKIIYESDRQLDLAATVAYEHHIMLNGGGYPERHFHRECHQASKIVHVCDVYDALRTKRPYREAWESEKTLELLIKGAGTDFDPELINQFTTMMRQLERRVAIVDDNTAIPQLAAAAAAAAELTKPASDEEAPGGAVVIASAPVSGDAPSAPDVPAPGTG